MNPEEKELLQKTYELSEENNKILHSIRRGNRWSYFFKITYWVLVIGVAFGAYFYIQPYVNVLSNTYHGVTSDIDDIKNIANKVVSPFK